ncbi:dipeptidase [Konateibacter massiliensis]|uniref:dipeptidase n=1 Tax=Konateibacter massiliensis TaxID=2002841 RepID=UPI000C15B758|nr:membrane dipeptidase [Konateibacter massiliensis]
MALFRNEYEERAYYLHQENPVVDAHLDLAAEIYQRHQNGERHVIEKHYLENLKRAGINVIASSIFVETKQLPARGLELTLYQISALLKEIEELRDEVCLIKNKSDLEAVINGNKIGILLYFEGLDIVTSDCSMLRAFYEMGIRGASLTWSRRNYLGEGCCKASQYEDIRGGLSKLGIETIQMMEKLSMFLDVSHLNDDGFEDVAACTMKPFAATHSNARNIHDSYRNLTDGQIKRLAKSGGVIGLNAYKDIVGADPANHPIDKMCQHTRHIMEIAGEEHVGYGLDLCEAYERAVLKTDRLEEPLDCIRNHGELIQVSSKFLQMGYSEETVKKIIGRNFVDYFRKVLPY